MSEASYQLNVQRGVTGKGSSTCLMASYDRLSPVTGIQTETYERYEELRMLFVQRVGDFAIYTPQDIATQFREQKAEFRRQLGVNTSKNIVETRANTVDELRNRLSKLAVGGYRTAVYLDLGGLHAVGVAALGDDTYSIKSTWSPFDDDPADVTQLFEYIDLAPRQRKRKISSKRTEPAANIVALPPEPAGSRPPFSVL